MEYITGLIGLLATLAAFYKIVAELGISRSTKHREDYNFAKDYLNDLEDENIHCFVKEKGFRALTGNIYSVDEIKYLLSLKEPTKAINLRSSAKSVVDFDPKSSRYAWKWAFKCKMFRRFASEIGLACYIIFASLALVPIFFDTLYFSSSSSRYSFVLSTAVIAIWSLSKQMDYKDAEKLMHLQRA